MKKIKFTIESGIHAGSESFNVSASTVACVSRYLVLQIELITTPDGTIWITKIRI